MLSTILSQAQPVTESADKSQAFSYDVIVDTVIKLTTEYGLKVLAAIAIFIVGKLATRLVVNIVTKVLKSRGVDQAVVSFTTNLVSISLTVFIIIAILGQLGVKTGSLIAVIGAAGLAIGLALQGSLSNFAAGFLIIVFKPFKAGDFIETNGVSGVVEHIYIFTSELRTPDNKLVIIPNSKMTDDNIINYSSTGQRRVDMVIGIAYDASIDEARDILMDILGKDERVLEDPAPVVVVGELADSSVNLKVRPWVKVDDYWKVYFSVLEQAKKRFDEAGIGIPFPQRDVHLYTADSK